MILLHSCDKNGDRLFVLTVRLLNFANAFLLLVLLVMHLCHLTHRQKTVVANRTSTTDTVAIFQSLDTEALEMWLLLKEEEIEGKRLGAFYCFITQHPAADTVLSYVPLNKEKKI